MFHCLTYSFKVRNILLNCFSVYVYLCGGIWEGMHMCMVSRYRHREVLHSFTSTHQKDEALGVDPG